MGRRGRSRDGDVRGWVLSSQPQGVFEVVWLGQWKMTHWQLLLTGSKWLCQEPGAPPGWGRPLAPLPWEGAV